MTKTTAEIAEQVGGHVQGDPNLVIHDVSSLEHVQPNTLVWADSEKNLEKALASVAGAVVAGQSAVAKRPSGRSSEDGGKTLIIAVNPRLAFAQAVNLFHPPEAIVKGIHPTAQIASNALLGDNVAVGPYVIIEEGTLIGSRTEIGAHTYIGPEVRIGEECRIYPGARFYRNVTVGARCFIHSGVVIGSDGFGFVPHEGHYHKFPQVGTVVIGDDVEIGANSTIDRGALDATRIGCGTKIDNLVQIAHNVEIGDDVVIAAQTGISGGTVIEDHCVIGGQVGMGDHARVKRGAVVGSKAGILPGKIIREGQVVWGIPAIPLDAYKVLNALWRGLPKMKAEIEGLKREKSEKSGTVEKGGKGRKSGIRKGRSPQSR